MCFSRNIENPATMLAVHRIRIVPVETAIGARQIDLCRAEDRLHQSQEQGDAEDHDHHRHQPADAVGHGDVAETGCRQRGYGEIERVEIVVDVGVAVVLDHEDEGRHDKNEYDQVDARLKNLLVAAEPLRRLAQLLQQVIGAHQPQHAHNAQEGEILEEGRSDQRDDHHKISKRCEAEEVFGPPSFGDQTCNIVERKNRGDRIIQLMMDAVLVDHRRDDEITDGDQVEQQKRVPERPRPDRVAKIELAQDRLQTPLRVRHRLPLFPCELTGIRCVRWLDHSCRCRTMLLQTSCLFSRPTALMSAVDQPEPPECR